MTTRVIHLRRPASLSIDDGPFVPDRTPDMLDQVDDRWNDLCEQNPAFFDGRIYHVLGVSRNGCGGAVVHVVDCAYRFYAVQSDDFDLGVRGLGVKAFTMRDGAVLVGKRSDTVGLYQNLWEFAPGGVVDPGSDPAAMIFKELQEETSMECAQEPTPVAVLSDAAARTWEIVYIIHNATGEPCVTAEYSDVKWCHPSALPEALTPIAKTMAPLCPKE